MDEKMLKKYLDEQTKEIKRHQKMFLEEFQSRLKTVAEVQTDHTRKINTLMEMTAMNTETLEIIKSMLKRKVDLDEFELLVKRVTLLERKMRV